MKLPIQKIESVAANGRYEKDERTRLHNVYFDAKKSRLAASNGKALAVIPVDKDDLDEGDTSGYLSPEALAAARKDKTHPTADKHLKANDMLEIPCGWTFPRPDEKELGDFPDIDQVTPDKNAAEVLLTINSELLSRLWSAIGDPDRVFTADGKYVTLYLKPDADGVVRTGMYAEANALKTFGVIMPIQSEWPKGHPMQVKAEKLKKAALAPNVEVVSVELGPEPKKED